MADPAWVALSLLRHVGGKTLNALLEQFQGDPRAVLAADPTALQRVRGVGPKIAQAIAQVNLPQVEKAMIAWDRAGVKIVVRDDAAYPPRLRTLDDEPPTLFIRGQWGTAIWDKMVAVVGTRRPSPKSTRFTHDLCANLADQGWTIVSGLAYGIDKAALSVPFARTVAVLGSGVLNIYPPEHISLAENIIQNGALICEINPQATVSPPALVARNRIISGLCSHVIVIESTVDGGAMHAARRAHDQGRTLYTLDIAASGNRQLIADGAIPIPPDVKHFTLED